MSRMQRDGTCPGVVHTGPRPEAHRLPNVSLGTNERLGQQSETGGRRGQPVVNLLPEPDTKEHSDLPVKVTA